MLALVVTVATAFAASYNITFCADYDVAYDDADASFGDDYITTDTTYPARGARLKVVRNSDGYVMRDSFMTWDGATPGCQSTAVALDSAETYDVKVKSYASVNGNTLYVYSDDVAWGIYLYGPGTYAPTASGTYTVTTPTGASQWRIANAVGHAMYRRAAGLSGETFTFLNEVCSGGGSCYERTPDWVYISSGGSGNKYIIDHEFGHMFAARTNDTGTCATDSCAAAHDYGAPYNNCFSSGSTSNHSANQQEYASSAVWEGIAHYYAAVAFNDSTESDCGFVYYKNTDWNLDGDVADSQETADFAVSCESYPTIAASADYLGSYCEDGVGDPCGSGANGNCDNRSTEYDWLRFFWDIDSDMGVSTTNIYNIWDEGDSDTWNATDVGAAANDPAPRLRTAADTLGFLTEWDARDDVNGVHR